MKKEDLMIGDWFWWEAEGKKYPMQVTEKTFALLDEDVWNFEPIPLTSEILEKNGIKLFSTYTHPYRDGEWEDGELEEAMKLYPMYVYKELNSIIFVIRPNEQELKVWSSNDKTRVEKKNKVIFVHELQHALKLCKIDKEIEL